MEKLKRKNDSIAEKILDAVDDEIHRRYGEEIRPIFQPDPFDHGLLHLIKLRRAERAENRDKIKRGVRLQ